MQTAPWLGLLPGADGQVLHSQDGGDSPLVSLFKSAAAAIVSSRACPSPVSFNLLSKQAEAAGKTYGLKKSVDYIFLYGWINITFTQFRCTLILTFFECSISIILVWDICFI